MPFLNFITAGLRFATRHKRLVLVLWLVPLVPALILGILAAANLMPGLGSSLFADRILDGDALFAYLEFRSSPADDLSPILSYGIFVMFLLTLLTQVLISAGVVEVALERTAENPLVKGIRTNLFSFLRTAGLSLITTALVAVVSVVVGRGFFKLAEAKADGRLDIIGVIVAAALFWLLWAPLDLAADLSRIAAARHDQRSMTFGFVRALGSVLRRPLTFAPLALSFLVLPLIIHVAYTLARAPWTPSSTAAVFVLLIAQQAVMMLRAALKLSFWGAGVAAYRHLDEPELCRKREKKRELPKAAAPEETVEATDAPTDGPEVIPEPVVEEEQPTALI